MPLLPDATFTPTEAEGSPLVHAFFDVHTSTWTFVVVDPITQESFIIDSVLHFDPSSGKITSTAAEGLASFVRDRQYKVVGIVETHVHADHVTAASVLKRLLPGNVPVYIGRKVGQVQATFTPVYGLHPEDFEGSFDGYLEDGGSLRLGDISVRTCGLPGHTPDSMGILVGDSLFAGDSIFLPDIGTARVDFPGGSASDLHRSIQRIFKLGADVRVFSGHDYPVGREKACMTILSEQRFNNKHVGGDASEEEFRRMRQERDASLGTPKLLHPSLQFNLRGGRMPPPDVEGRRFIRIPLMDDTAHEHQR